MRRILLVVLAICLVLLFGCAKEVRTPDKDKVDVSKNIIIDSIDSTILGYIFDHMDEYDKEKLSYALANAKPDIPYEWENPQAETSYRFTIYSEDAAKKEECQKAEIYSAHKRLKACAEIRFDPERGWMLKPQH